MPKTVRKYKSEGLSLAVESFPQPARFRQNRQ
jgi:hypothetical protein